MRVRKEVKEAFRGGSDKKLEETRLCVSELFIFTQEYQEVKRRIMKRKKRQRKS